MRKAVILALAVLASGCGKINSVMERVIPDAKSMAGIKTIQIRDHTSEIIRESTNSNIMPGYVAMAIKERGYSVCMEPCKADATLTVDSLEFSSEFDRNVHNVIICNIDIHNGDGILLMHYKIRSGSSVEQRTFAAKAAREMASRIPAAQ